MPRGFLLAVFVWLATAVHGRVVWLKGELPGVRVYSDAGKSDVAEFTVRYGAFHRTFDALVAPPGRTSPMTTVLLFRELETLHRYADAKETEGFQLVSLENIVDGSSLVALALSGDREEALIQAIDFDSGFMLQGLGYFAPIWMSQGTGEVFSALRLHSSSATVGAIQDRLAAPLSERPWVPWDRFFVESQGSEEYRGKPGHFTGIYQAQAWAVMKAILVTSGPEESRRRMLQLNSRIRGTSADAATVASLLGVEPGKLRRRLSEYGEKMEVPVDVAQLRAAARVGPAPEAEVRVQLANLLLERDGLQSQVQLDRARALAPDSAMVKEAVARQYLHEQNRSEAARAYSEAIDAGSADPFAFFVTAEDRLSDLSSGGSDIAGSGGEAAAGVVKAIRRGLALDPGHTQAYVLLARALFIAPRITAQDIAILAPAVADPRMGPVMEFYRGMLCRRIGDKAMARADFQAVADDARTPASLRKSAHAMVVRMDAPPPAPKRVETAPTVAATPAPPIATPAVAHEADPVDPLGVTMKVANRHWQDFQPYLQAMAVKLREGWRPPAAKDGKGFSGEISVTFTMSADGNVVRIDRAVGENAPEAWLSACKQAVTGAAPYEPWSDTMTEIFGNEQHLIFVFNLTSS